MQEARQLVAQLANGQFLEQISYRLLRTLNREIDGRLDDLARVCFNDSRQRFEERPCFVEIEVFDVRACICESGPELVEKIDCSLRPDLQRVAELDQWIEELRNTQAIDLLDRETQVVVECRDRLRACLAKTADRGFEARSIA